MIICPKCGAQNPDGMLYCGNCKTELPKMTPPVQTQPAQPQPYPYMQQPMAPRRNPLLLIAIILVAVIVIIAVIAVVLMQPRGVQINEWDADGYSLFIVGDVRFTVNITNHDSEVVTKSIICTVVFDDGDSYTQTKQVTLNARETKIVTVDVMVTDMSHLSEINGEDWTTVTCALL